MGSHKNTKKGKKTIETTLGKAPPKAPSENENDLSLLRKPIETSITGIKQILTVWESATNEVKKLLMHECDIMFECRICRSIFRSLANFILHKRNYCKHEVLSVDCMNSRNSFAINTEPSIAQPKATTSPLENVIQKLQEIEHIREATKPLLTAELKLEKPIKSMDDREVQASNFNELVMEKIDSNDSGVFQTLVNDSASIPNSPRQSMKTEIMELHRKLENDVPVIDLEGKICGFTNSELHKISLFPKSELKCIECNNKFATQKSLTNHIKCVHNPSRILYICPTCKDTFASPWSVYRHLLRVHRMTNKQVRRMREQINNSWIRRDGEASIQKKTSAEVKKVQGECDNQWINDIEGDKDFQMCAGCGKHFDRKAALHSHSQMCAKRLEVCNNIKENAKRKGGEKSSEKTKINKLTADKMVLRGALKRKNNSCRRRNVATENNKSLNHTQRTDETMLEETSKKLVDSEKTEIITMYSIEENNEEFGINSDSNNLYFKDNSDKLYFANTQENLESTQGKETLNLPSSRNSSRSNSPANSDCQIISRASSIDEAIYLNSSNDSFPNSISPNDNKSSIKRIKLAEKDPLSLDSPKSNKSYGISFDSNSSDQNGPNSGLFTNVSFDNFHEKVKKPCENKKQAEAKTRKRKSFEPRNKEISSIKFPIKTEIGSLCEEGNDDVVFINETVDAIYTDEQVLQDSRDTNEALLSVDLSNLPLLSNPKPNCSIDNNGVNEQNENISNNKNDEGNFIKRATPYIDQEKLLCIACGLNFASFDLLLWHMSAHFSWFRFQCSKCSFVTFNKSDCTSHARIDHKLKDNEEYGYVLPLPNWKTVLMSHEFELLKDGKNLKGMHTDEQISVEELLDEDSSSLDEVSEHLEAALFGDCTNLYDKSTAVIKSEDKVFSNDNDKGVIDVQQMVDDSQILPEPIELAMPADISEVYKTVNFEEEVALINDKFDLLDHNPDESNDDWGLSNVYQFSEVVTVTSATEETEETNQQNLYMNGRPTRMRTRTKLDENFLYYDNANGSLKMPELFKNGSLKLRVENPVTTKPKATAKTVPTIQKKKI